MLSLLLLIFIIIRFCAWCKIQDILKKLNSLFRKCHFYLDLLHSLLNRNIFHCILLVSYSSRFYFGLLMEWRPLGSFWDCVGFFHLLCWFFHDMFCLVWIVLDVCISCCNCLIWALKVSSSFCDRPELGCAGNFSLRLLLFRALSVSMEGVGFFGVNRYLR